MKPVALFAVLVLLPCVGQAADLAVQTSAPDAVIEGSSVQTDGPSPNWGGAARSFVTLGAWAAAPIDSSVTYTFNNFAGGQGVTRTGGSSFFKVPVQLPNGALVNEIELNYCDTGAGQIQAHWFRQVKNAGPVFIASVVSSVGTPGCVVTTGTFPAQTVDNNLNSYNIELFMSDATVAFLSARVGYRLQVSPAPATATFSDVPVGAAQHRFVEALAAAGITGGCGGGNYCPNDPVTRGQMAVFLAASLGLHFPN